MVRESISTLLTLSVCQTHQGILRVLVFSFTYSIMALIPIYKDDGIAEDPECRLDGQ